MRKLIMGIMLVTSFNASATDCTMLHDVAEQIMIARQNGAPITKVIELSKAVPGIKPLIIAAYKETKFNSEKYQQNAVSEFANQVYLACVEVEQ